MRIQSASALAQALATSPPGRFRISPTGPRCALLAKPAGRRPANWTRIQVDPLLRPRVHARVINNHW